MSKKNICPNCSEGKLVWKRKSENVFGWILRFYRCNVCASEIRKEEMPKELEENTIDILELNELNQ